MTLVDLSEEFMKNYCAGRLRETTVRGYRVNLENHVVPVLGEDTLIEALTVRDLDRLSEELIAVKGLSKKSVIYCHATLRKALNWAKKRSYIMVNPYDCYDLPRAEDFSWKTLTEEQMRKMLSLVDGVSAFDVAVRLSLKYGLRRGEVLGIIPGQDLNFERCILHIQRTRTEVDGKTVVTPCKTKGSNRYILLEGWDSLTLAGRGRAAPKDYAVPLSTNQLQKQFRKFLALNSFPDIRFHDLRHSYATFMLMQGVNPKIVSGVLGHSGVDITLDIYSHPDLSAQKACLHAFEGVTQD